MKSMNSPKIATVKPKFCYHKPTVSLEYQNILNQQFDPSEPNRAWVSDITYIPVKNKFVYLCVILDLFSRRVIAWQVSHRMTASLVIDTLLLIKDSPVNRAYSILIGGSQYTSVAFQQFLDTHNLVTYYSKSGVSPILVLLLLGIAAPIMEEIVFRGDIIGYHIENNAPLAIIISSFLFGIVHGPTKLISCCMYFLMGIIFSISYYKTKDLRVSIFIYFFNNLLPAIAML